MDWKDYFDLHRGESAIILGKGPSAAEWARLPRDGRKVIAINDAGKIAPADYHISRHNRVNLSIPEAPGVWFMPLVDGWELDNTPYSSLEFRYPAVPGAIWFVPTPCPGRVVDRDVLRDLRLMPTPGGSAVNATILAWYMGFSSVEFVGVDGGSALAASNTLTLIAPPAGSCYDDLLKHTKWVASLYYPDKHHFFRTPPPMTTSPSSAATVTTIETLPEATLAIRSFLHFHPETPVFVACPADLASRVALIHPSVVPVPRRLALPDTVASHNSFHRADAILLKMDAMEEALSKFPDVFFFDADLVFLKSVGLPAGGGELALSCNMAETRDMAVTASRYGLFNAGFLWTSSQDFPSWWRSAYLAPTQEGAFYEQTCLSLAPSAFRTSYFPHECNYGFWRGPIGSRPASSIHVHMTDSLGLSPWMRSKVVPLRRAVIQRIPEPLLPLLRETCDHPKKIFFIHYGKAGGVYCNIALKGVLRGYTLHDSWVVRPDGELRDWKNEELDAILSSKDGGRRYLHQHQTNVSSYHVEVALKEGWKTVMFYRDPREVICSLYHWSEEHVKSGAECPIFLENRPSMSFDAFFQRIVLPEWQDRWALPWWAGMVDHLHPFSPGSLDIVCEKLFGTHHTPHDVLNSSGNPGWQVHLLPDHLAQLESLPRYRRSMDWLAQYDERLLNDTCAPLAIEALLDAAA
jgi:hypothetical protein